MPICGKKVFRLGNENEFVLMHDFVCSDCWSNGKEHAGETSCGNCAYCLTRIGLVEKINLMSAFMTGQGTYAEQVKLYTCAKFGFDVTNKLTEFAEKCTSYLKKEEYQEKCLKGELTSDSVTCPYCQTKYDRVKQANCPHCGAYPRGK